METINKLKKLYANTNYTPNKWENDLGVTYALFSAKDNNSINIENSETVDAIAKNFDEFNTLLSVMPETPHFVVYDNAWIFRSLSWYKYDTVINTTSQLVVRLWSETMKSIALHTITLSYKI